MNLTSSLPLAALICALSVVPALAKPSYVTKYSYYAVGGDTAEEIYSGMLRKGPRVNGAKAYAATTATSVQEGRLLQASSCKIDGYKLRIDFVIKLPKIKNEQALPSSDRARWKQFSQFLKKHEETHRSIWLGCAADLERKVRAIKAKSCKDADAKATKLWNATRAACGKKHEAFDNAEQKRLMQHPFVKLVYKRSMKSTHAAKAQ